MKLEWINDLLAIVEEGSLSRAAKKRFLTQPAFSRRIRVIEESVGAELIDRSRKPVQLKLSVLNLEPRLREAAQSLSELKRELGESDTERQELVIVGQHAISTAIAPHLVQTVTASMDASVRLRSANREECYALLYSHQADIALLYQLDNESNSLREQYVETRALQPDPLIPVVAREQEEAVHKSLENGFLPIIAYPSDVFLGMVLRRTIQPQLSGSIEFSWIAETALTTAALQFAISGIGLAWVPQSLATPPISRGELVNLNTVLPEVPMTVFALRLHKARNSTVDSAWSAVTNT